VSASILGICGIIIFLIILFAGLPVSMSMLLIGFIGICILRSPSAAFNMVSDSFVSMFSSYTMSVAPMFILMGVIASHSGVGSSLIKTVDKFIGHKRGGLALGVQAVCALFGAICGSMPATVATIGSLAYPEMKARGYKDTLSTASVCAGASLAILIPPSLTFIIYGNATSVSVGKLFASGIISGIILMLLYITTVAILCKINPSLAPIAEKATRQERITAIRSGGIIESLLFLQLQWVVCSWACLHRRKRVR
jgi:tripartite ATP-independent transporter DctM subunit